MRTLAAALALCCFAPALPAGSTLEDFARRHPLSVYTVAPGAGIPLDPEDQSNNRQEGDHVLPLSRKGLTGIAGISRMTVLLDGKPVPLRSVGRLHVCLNHNDIREIPAEFFDLQNVQWLYLYYNPGLAAIPPGIARMKGMLGMYFTGNSISVIPTEVFTMTGLKKLQVSKNRLTELPPAIGNLTELRHFSVADNAIEAIPDTVSRLTRLRVCDLSGNRIAKLPDSFGKVRIVHQLRVCNNPLTSLPEGFAGMPGSIDITGTKIRVETLSPGLRAQIGSEKR